MDDKKFLDKIYEEIRGEIRDICHGNEDPKEQDKLLEVWLECIDHHDVDRITPHIGAISGLLQSIDKMVDELDSNLRDEGFEKRAVRWLGVIGYD